MRILSKLRTHPVALVRSLREINGMDHRIESVTSAETPEISRVSYTQMSSTCDQSSNFWVGSEKPDALGWQGVSILGVRMCTQKVLAVSDSSLRDCLASHPIQSDQSLSPGAKGQVLRGPFLLTWLAFLVMVLQPKRSGRLTIRV